ncbi:MAG: hypothetical protein JO112_08160 [Planctomycetes bacterium]|nr:hypothetical protein [Planctomycetota bacterium]
MPTAGDDFSLETSDPSVKIRRPRPRSQDRSEEAEDREAAPAAVFDPAQDLPGAVFMVPNRQWGFEGLTSDDHPGACAHYQERTREAILVKGTDAGHVRLPRRFYVVAPTPGNGLSKETAFELVPRYFRLHRVRLFYPERHLGRLDEAALHGLCDELARLHPEE